MAEDESGRSTGPITFWCSRSFIWLYISPSWKWESDVRARSHPSLEGTSCNHRDIWYTKSRFLQIPATRYVTLVSYPSMTRLYFLNSRYSAAAILQRSCTPSPKPSCFLPTLLSPRSNWYRRTSFQMMNFASHKRQSSRYRNSASRSLLQD